jgi:sodium/hydrogen antiporter
VNFISWLALIGAVLMVIALSSTFLRRLPVSGAMVYLALGVGAGPLGLGLIRVDPIGDANWLEHVTEIVLIVSLFVGGLKLRLPPHAPEWRAAYRLAGPVMLLGIAGVTLLGYFAFGLTPAAALLLGAVLAPTDPVLASEVTVANAKDKDRMRYALSGEAGLNDGAAFPFVILALLLVENNGQLGSWLGGWALERLLWAVPVGLAVGYGLGWTFGRIAIEIRRRSTEAVAAHDLLVLALVLLSYSAAEFAHGWGFLAAFAAGLGLRRAEFSSSKKAAPLSQQELNAFASGNLPADAPAELILAQEEQLAQSDHPVIASGQVLREVLSFGEALERLMSVAVVVLVGALVSVAWDWRGVIVALLLFVVIRPLAVMIGLIGTPTDGRQRTMIAWFGLRGIGTLYYLAYAVGEGVGRTRAIEVWSLALTVVACSIVVHGISVTPLLDGYERALERRRNRRAPSARA